VRAAFSKYSKIENTSGLAGAQVAEQILTHNGIDDVQVVRVQGDMTDHYNPGNRTVNLSESVFGSRSVSAEAVAAHEVGHVTQHTCSYFPLKLRSAIWPVAQFATNVWWILLLVGVILGAIGLAYFAVALFAAVIVFQLVTLPVEFNASRRAKKQLQELDIVDENSSDTKGAQTVLRAAAMTYVAAALASLLTLFYYLTILRR